MKWNKVKFRCFAGDTETLIYDVFPVTNRVAVQRIDNGKCFQELWIECDEVEQFTGLFDCNEKEIYEGDIVRSKWHSPELYTVDFIEGGFCCTYSNDSIPLDINHFYPSIGCQIKVIGNIHENYDLISEST